MVKMFSNGISRSDLWVSSHDRISDFYLTSWQRGDSPLPMLLVRLLLSCITITIFSWSLWNVADPYWLIFLTNWGLSLVTLLTLSGLLVSCFAAFRKLPERRNLPWFVSMYWLLYNLTITIAIMITFLYWVLLYSEDLKESQTSAQFWLDVATHGLNSCVVFVEIVLSRTPHRLLHIYQPLGVGVWYAVFSAIYYAAGGTDSDGNPFIYEILNWERADEAAVLVTLAAVGLIVLYTVIWGFSICRDKLSTKLIRTTSLNLPFTPPDRHSTGIV